MAGAMSRILGFAQKKTTISTSTTTPVVVLSKTTTPLQRLRNTELKEMEAARIKRREKRTINLTAMHIPLSSASSVGVAIKSKKGKRPEGSDVDVGASIGKELGMEKIHRRVATRGVVALFNTISMHQQERAQRAAEAGIGYLASSTSNKAESKKTKEELQNMSKHGFLDMLKKTNASGDASTNKGPFSSSSKNNSADGTTKSSGIKTLKNKKQTSDGWNALKDDFMMNSKLKDWDKQMSSSDEDVDDMDDDEEDGGSGGGKKRGDIDAVMDDDDSSSGDDDDDDSGGRGKRGRGGKKRRKV